MSLLVLADIGVAMVVCRYRSRRLAASNRNAADSPDDEDVIIDTLQPEPVAPKPTVREGKITAAAAAVAVTAVHHAKI